MGVFSAAKQKIDFVGFFFVFDLVECVSGIMKGDDKRSWAVSPSNAAFHFGTSGLSVAIATGITHPLGILISYIIVLIIINNKVKGKRNEKVVVVLSIFFFIFHNNI